MNPALRASAVKPSAAKTAVPKAKAAQGQENEPRPNTAKRKQLVRLRARAAKAPRVDETRQLALDRPPRP